ncbi:MAG TPA: hypothetical protein VGM37_14615 [Armatimonadota bacterium]
MRVYAFDDPEIVTVSDEDGDAVSLSVEAVGADLLCPVTLRVSQYRRAKDGAIDDPAFYAAATCPICGRLLNVGASLDRKDLDAAMFRVAHHVESCPGEVAP